MKLNTEVVHKYISSNPNLKAFYQYYLGNCLSLSVPYHNMRHTLGMIYHIIRMYEKSKTDISTDVHITDDDLYILITSALFHDYNHSAGRFSDQVNVRNAKDGLECCLRNILPASDLRDRIILSCKKNIDATQYPYIIPDDELDIQQRILREIDILVCLYDDFITQSLMGLAAEMHQANLMNFSVDYLKFLLKSIESLKLKYCVDTWLQERERFLAEIDAFAEAVSQEENGY